MPFLRLDENGEAVYSCDKCGIEMGERDGGSCCPTCGRLFCVYHGDIQRIRVNETGPDYKKDAFMCEFCQEQWRRQHPKQVRLDAFNV